MSTMITFAANNEFFRKRKRVHRACESCKKRRVRPRVAKSKEARDLTSPQKRCSHTFDDETEAGSSTQNGTSAPQPTSGEHQSQSSLASAHGKIVSRNEPQHASQHDAGSPYSPSDQAAETPPNFMGYLNPEAVLREQVHSGKGTTTTKSAAAPAVGWFDADAARRPASLVGSITSPLNETSPNFAQEAKIQRAHQQYLEALGVHILPPRQSQEALLDIYFEYVHPLLPLVDKDVFSDQYSRGVESCMLLQSMCLVASKHADASAFLVLGEETRKLGPRDFSHRLYNAIIAGIEAKLEKNRVILIQTLALISLHCEGPDGAEQASMHLAQAIHHAHTFGLQFGQQWKGQKSDSQENLEDLFWCLWSLDRINACMNGRPSIIHERDNTMTRLPTDPEKRSSPFGVWLQISDMLDKVIDYYRPGGSSDETGWESSDFLGFEEMVGDGEDKLDGPIMTFLSVYHHTMCMASHKSLSINAPVKSTPSYTRQSLSATRVIHLLNAEAPERLPPLPLIPYALSVALSVVYRHFRSRRLKVHINRATEELKQCVDLLNRLRPAWWSAGTMADLGMAVLNNADRNTRAANTPTATADLPAPPSPVPKSTQRDIPSGVQQVSTSPMWQGPQNATPVDPRLHQRGPTPVANMTNLLNPVMPLSTLGQHPTSSERANRERQQHFLSQSPHTLLQPAQAPPQVHPATLLSPPTASGTGFDLPDASPDWLNFDTAFENFEGLLGSSGADLSHELFRPLGYDGVDGFIDEPS